MSRKEVRNVLGFWYHQALFSPLAPSAALQAQAKPEQLPWQEDPENKQGPYRLYGGLAAAEELLAGLPKPAEPALSTYEERKTCLYTLALDAKGHYVPHSFHLAYFPWAVGLLYEAAANGSRTPFLNPNDCSALSEELDEELRLSNPQFTAAMIEALNQSLERLLLGEGKHLFDHGWFVLEEAKDAADDIQLQDPVLPELRRAAERFEPKDDLPKFLSGLTRRESLTAVPFSDPAEWKPFLKPEAYAPAQWPAADYPKLGRQNILNRIYAEEQKGSLHFYQAPQTSERTAVLSNILAAEVCRRAEFLAGLTKPADAFTMRRFQYPPNDFSGNYYVPFMQLSRMDLLCSAEDAESLKKLALDLADPTFINRAHSHSDSFDLKRHKELYFTSLAKSFLPGTPWGLAAVYIEDEKTLLALVRALIEQLSPKASVWKEYDSGEDRLLSWEEARLRFLRLRDKVQVKIDSLTQIYRQSEEVVAVETERDELEERLQALNSQISAEKEELMRQQEQCAVNKEHYEGRLADEQSYKKDMRGFRKLLYILFKAGPYARGLAAIRSKIEESRQVLSRTQAALEEEERRLRDRELKAELLTKQLQLKEKQIEDKLPSTELMRAALGANYVDHRFYKNLDKEENQAVCPWMDHELAGLRERMFKASLDLLKTFCVHANEVTQNLKRLELLLEGRFTESDQAEALPHLLHTLRLIIPLSIMPRAFMSRLERYGGKAEAGTLLYLDPERSRPEDLVGLFWRAYKTFCFGDVLQLPRVFKPLDALDDALREGFGLPEIYSRKRYAAADYLLGAAPKLYKINKLELPFPLRYNTVQDKVLHALDNQLCLQGLWLGEGREAENYPEDFLEDSSWLDIGGACEEKSLFVYFQADILSDMLANYAEQHGKLPNIGIACFYPSVYEGLRNYIQEHWFEEESLFLELFSRTEIEQWLAEHCFLLSAWNGRLRDELVFLTGGDEETDEHYLNLFFNDPRALHSVLNGARRHLLILANAAVWAVRPPLDRVFAELNHEESPSEMQKKTLVFIRAGKSLQDEEKRLVGKSDSELSPEGRRNLLLLASDEGRFPETDRYYTSMLVRARETLPLLYPNAKKRMLEKSAFNEVGLGILEASELSEDNTQKLLKLWYEGEDIHPTTESRPALLKRAREAVKELLDELERLSLTSATIITHELFMKTYYDSLTSDPLGESLHFCHGGGFTAEYHRLGRHWKIGKLTLLPDSLAADEEDCRRILAALEKKQAAKEALSEAAQTPAETAAETAAAQDEAAAGEPAADKPAETLAENSGAQERAAAEETSEADERAQTKLPDAGADPLSGEAAEGDEATEDRS